MGENHHTSAQCVLDLMLVLLLCALQRLTLRDVYMVDFLPALQDLQDFSVTAGSGVVLLHLTNHYMFLLASHSMLVSQVTPMFLGKLLLYSRNYNVPIEAVQ